MQNKKWISMLLAFVISVGLWVYIVTVENPEGDLTLYNIPVMFDGREVLRQDYNLLLKETNVTNGVSLTFSGKRTDLNKLLENKSEISVVMDVTSRRASGDYSLYYDITDINLPAEVSSQDLKLESRSPDRINIALTDLITRSVPVKIQNDAELQEGYLFGRMTQSHTEISIEGPLEDVNRVAYAQVILERENVDQTITANLGYTLIDANGEPVESTEITSTVSEIEVALPVFMYRDIPLEVTLIEGGGATEKDCVIDIEPKTIQLSGDPVTLESIQSVKLSSAIDLSSLMSNTETLTRGITIPAECTNISGEVEAKVTIQIKNKAIRQIRIPSTDFQYLNFPSDLEPVSRSSALMVTVRANASDIELITEENLRVVADFSGIQAEPNTTMTVPVKIYVDGFDDAGVIGETEYSIVVDLLQPSDEEEKSQ